MVSVELCLGVGVTDRTSGQCGVMCGVGVADRTSGQCGVMFGGSCD